MGGVWRTAKRMKRTCVGALRSKRGGGEGCGIPQNVTPRDTVHLHRRPPLASTGYRRPPPAFTGSCSSSLHRSLLHRLLFNHPSTGTLHRLLFIQPSTKRGPVQPPLHGHPSTVYCSSSPPHHGVLFIQRQRHRSLFIHPPPPRNTHCSSNRSALVSSSSEGIAPSGSVNSHRSIARVQ